MRKDPKRGRRNGAAALCAAAVAAICAGAGPASAGLCGLEVFDSERGVAGGASDRGFAVREQFVVCVRASADGVVSLWDRMPTSGPVERLAPNPRSRRAEARAIPVSAGERVCFGDGSDGYYLAMTDEDGIGPGLMWAVFTESEETHPVESSFSSTESFADSFERYGAGSLKDSMDAKPARPGRSVSETAEAPCEPRNSLRYFYVVR
ncbi:MAG: hypothetical protein AAFR16_06770 [Pseudomonadota bacterium]